MKRTFPVWQITFPLGVVLIFTLGTATAIWLAHGRYTFEFEASPKQIRVRTDIEKKERESMEEISEQTISVGKNALETKP